MSQINGNPKMQDQVSIARAVEHVGQLYQFLLCPQRRMVGLCLDGKEKPSID